MCEKLDAGLHYLQIVEFLNANLGLLILISALFLIGDLFGALPLPLNLPGPVFFASGAVLQVIFLVRLFLLSGEITDAPVFSVLEGRSISSSSSSRGTSRSLQTGHDPGLLEPFHLLEGAYRVVARSPGLRVDVHQHKELMLAVLPEGKGRPVLLRLEPERFEEYPDLVVGGIRGKILPDPGQHGLLCVPDRKSTRLNSSH